MYITEMNGDAELIPALTNFKTVSAANAVTLGLSLPQQGEISDAATDFEAAMDAWIAAKAAAEAARRAKDEQKSASKAVIAKWAKVFRADVSISDALLGSLMLAPHETPKTNTPPSTPLNLVGNADGNGAIKLRWKRGDNRYGTIFVVEYRTSAAAEWVQHGTTTKTSYDIQWTPGQYVSFRLTAVRSSQKSPVSAPFTFWNGSTTLELTEAA